MDILVSFKNEGKSPYSLLELLSIEKKLADKLGFPVEIVNEKSIKNNILKDSIFADLLIIYPPLEKKSGKLSSLRHKIKVRMSNADIDMQLNTIPDEWQKDT